MSPVRGRTPSMAGLGLDEHADILLASTSSSASLPPNELASSTGSSRGGSSSNAYYQPTPLHHRRSRYRDCVCSRGVLLALLVFPVLLITLKSYGRPVQTGSTTNDLTLLGNLAATKDSPGGGALFSNADLDFIREVQRNATARPLPHVDGEEDEDAADAAAKGGKAQAHAQGLPHKLPKMCVVARTYGSQLAYLPLFLMSLYHSGFPDLQVLLLNTDNALPLEKMESATRIVNAIVGRDDFAQFLPFKQPEHLDRPDYGFYLTDKALDYLYEDDCPHKCEYLMFTNGDNLYLQNFGHHLRKAFARKSQLIGFDFVSRYNFTAETMRYEDPHSERSIIFDDGSNHMMEAWFGVGMIDLGAAAFLTSHLKNLRLKFIGEPDTHYRDQYWMGSDGDFIARMNGRSSVRPLSGV